VCLKAEPWLGVKRELGLFLVREMTLLRQSGNKGVGLKNQYHLFDHGEIFQIYVKMILGDSPVVSNYEFGDCFEGFKNVYGNVADQLQCDGRVK
jgi:hypothetical protein